MSPFILWLVIAVAALTLFGLNAGAIQTVGVLTLLVMAALTKIFARRWPKNLLSNIALFVLGPIILISIARIGFENIRYLDPGHGALFVLAILVFVFVVRSGWRRLQRWFR